MNLFIRIIKYYESGPDKEGKLGVCISSVKELDSKGNDIPDAFFSLDSNKVTLTPIYEFNMLDIQYGYDVHHTFSMGED